MANTIFLQELRQFNDPLSENDLLLFKIKRRVNMPADEDMGVRYSSFLTQLNLDRFVKKAGDTMTGDLVYINNRGIFGTSTGGQTRSIFKLDNADRIKIGHANHQIMISASVDPKVMVGSSEFVMYHSGNANKSNIDWRARDLVADQTLLVNGESTLSNLSIRKLSAIYGYDAGNFKVRMIGIDADDDVAVGVTNKRLGLLVKDPNEVWAVQEEGNTAKQWRMLNTGNFKGHLDSVYVLKTQTVNGKSLSGNITLTAADVGALPATGKVVASSYGDALTLQGVTAGLTFQESDTNKQYHIICDGETFRINEDNSGGKNVINFGGGLLTTDAVFRVNPTSSQYAGQAGWQIPIVSTNSMAITSASRPSGSDQYAGIGVHSNGSLYGWNQLAAKGYAFTINTDTAQFNRQIFENGQRVYSPNNKPTSSDVGLGNVPNTVHTTVATPNTVPLRDKDSDIHARLFRSSYQVDNTLPDTSAIAYRVNTTDNNYIRFCSDKSVINAWLGTLSRDLVNMDYSGNWADIINKIPRVSGAGTLEIGKYIDMRDTNSNRDFDVRLSANGTVGSQCLTVATVNGNIDIGAKDTSYAHIYTDRPSFYFNKPLYVVGTITTFEGSTITLKSSGRKHIRFEDTGTDGNIWKDPADAWNITHGDKAASTLQWSPNGELVVDGARWAATHIHSYDGQLGIKAPLHVDYGSVSGTGDYYPIVRGKSLASGAGYTTHVDLGFLRSSNQWSIGVLRVASCEAATPSANFYFRIEGDFEAPRNGSFNDVYIRSDETLKTNIKPLTGSLAGIMELEPTEYDKRKVDSEEYDMHEEGLIAQAVEKVFPNAVNTDQGTGLKSLKPYALIARLIGAIQEQQVMIQELMNDR